jgi:flagellar biosynthetic protein FlhB
MAEQDHNGERTELPTEHRRRESRERGQVARSSDLQSAALLLAVAAACHFYGASIVEALGRTLRDALSGPAWTTLDRALLWRTIGNAAGDVAAALAPLLAILFAAALCVGFGQSGFHITPTVLQPDWNRINPVQGFQRLVSLRGAVRLGVALGKLLLLGGVSVLLVWQQLGALLALIDTTPAQAAAAIGQTVVTTAFALASVLLALALADYGYQYWQHEQDLKMTRQELHDELRQMEGDPQIRSRRREAHRRLAQARQLQQVKTADVVVTNPTEIAVALKYDADTMAAPIVVAKGQGHLAARIRQLAREHGVPVVERKPLARALFHSVRVGDPIPLDLYEVVAEILAYVYRLRHRA